MSTLDELNMITSHQVRRSDRGAPLRAAERSDVASHMHGVDRDGVTMAELLRFSRAEHPELQRRLVALTAMTYGGHWEPPTTPERVGARGPELPAHVQAVRDRVRAQSDREQTRFGLPTRALGVCDYQ